MKKVSFTLIYIIAVVFAVNFFDVQGTTNSNETEKTATLTIDLKKNNHFFSIPNILVSGPIKPLPEPINFSLFGFGLFLVVGLGWIKRTSDKN
jgi:hypothetical protein